MKPQTGQIKFLLTYTVLFAFLICGIAGILSPMPSLATETHHSQPASPTSSSDENCCPDQLKSSEENSKRVPIVLLPVGGLGSLGSLADHFQSRLSKSFFKESKVSLSSYPPPFILFSVLLN